MPACAAAKAPTRRSMRSRTPASDASARATSSYALAIPVLSARAAPARSSSIWSAPMPPPISRSVRPAIPRASRKSTIRRPSPSSPLRRYFRASELARASPKTARRPFGSQQSAITRTLDARQANRFGTPSAVADLGLGVEHRPDEPERDLVSEQREAPAGERSRDGDSAHRPARARLVIDEVRTVGTERQRAAIDHGVVEHGLANVVACRGHRSVERRRDPRAVQENDLPAADRVVAGRRPRKAPERINDRRARA